MIFNPTPGPSPTNRSGESRVQPPPIPMGGPRGVKDDSLKRAV